MMVTLPRFIAFHRGAQRAAQLLLILVLLLAGMMIPALNASAAGSWRGEFYNNVSLGGAPILIRDDASINFDWGVGPPAPGVPADRFSVRWTSFQYFDAGTFTFYATADDGVRVYVDDQAIINEWHDHPATTYSGSRSLSAGYHSIRVEHYENAGEAVIKVWWQMGGGPPPTGAWRGEYYNNTWLGGPPLVRNDANVSFDWGYGAPAPGIGADNFSVRWVKDVYFGGGNVTFSATVDDGVRLWVDGALVIDRWYPQGRTTHSGTIYLGAGTHQVRVEYFEQAGVAVCMVGWSGGGQPGPQEIIVDDRDSNFVWGGPSGSWYQRSTGFRNHLYWTWNSRTQLNNWAKWFPYVPTAGNWEVYVYIANQYFGSKSAVYRIYHSGVQHDRVVNQNNYYGQWVSLGTYHFSGGANEYVFLGDNTGETYGTRFVGFDAAKFVFRGGGPGPGPTPVPPPPPPPPGCSIAPVLGFGRIYNNYPAVRSKLGCATEPEKGVWMAEEIFVGGYMYWRQDQNRIYVLYNNGTWAWFADTWMAGQPDYDPALVPPPGYYQPVRGFGKVWRENGAVRSGLGWATTQERGFYGSLQPFTGGTMFWSNVKGILVLYNDGRWERYD